MFRIENTLVSEEIIEKYFHCNISDCKGACCIKGEAGAPLEKKEAEKLENNYNKISEYLSDNANKLIKSKGSYIKLEEGNIETPLLNNKACVYVHYESNGSLSCGIEKAFNEKKINFNKPISCHLYPIRIKEYSEFTAVNYHQWSICSDACSLGAELKKPVFEFVKEALIRKFGNEWYNSLKKISKKLLKF
jgi:hypothetical protein